ncbi:MAG: sulfur carrier protein ThiS [Pirellulaceae bacterium]|nr:sulfur carrier protein ThiS [Pirellulaceae bacterium]
MELSQTNTLTVTINDIPQEIIEGCTLSQLIEQHGLNPRQIAVERNMEIVPPDDFSTTVLGPGDALEIVTLMGGG